MNELIKPCDFRIHDMIDNKYRVERILDHAAFDCRYKVNDEQGHGFILKLFKLWLMSPQMQQRIAARSQSEINSCRIKSNYLAPIVSTGTVNGNPYLLTEYCPSTELSRLVRSPKLDVAHVLKQILYGLRDLHKHGKVHCRLTPGNVLVTDQGRVRLTDYVLLGDRNSALPEKRNVVNRSWAYIAPERYRLERCATVLPTVDIFAFGVIAYQMVTGELPFGHLNNENDWLHYQGRALSGDWKKNVLARMPQSEQWSRVFEACLQPLPAERAQTADEVLSLFSDVTDEYIPVEGSSADSQMSVVNGLLLRVMQGDDYGKVYRLNELSKGRHRILTVGREDESTFNVIAIRETTTTYISRRHCTIEWDDEANVWYLRDGQWDKEAKDKWARSLNGTYINSKEVSNEGCQIVPGDIIALGDVKLRVEGY